VPGYLVETYLSRHQTGERSAREGRASSVAKELTLRGTSVSFEHSIHVPEDEICFFLFDAVSERAVALVARRAELDPIRVVNAVSSRKVWER
jgi:hypothetical protein